MREIESRDFFINVQDRKEPLPLKGQLALTYRCNLDCIHCYCKGSEDAQSELTTGEWKDILTTLHEEGCIYLTLSGGEPLLREDFLELYACAREKGFILSVFTNATLFTKKIIEYFKRSPPFKIEVTLNGITKSTYESITQKEGSFEKAIKALVRLEQKGLPLILKANLLKQNKDELGKIKAFADIILGKQGGKFHFKYDPMVYPRLNKDRAPCDHRLSFEELQDVTRQDLDISRQYQESLYRDSVNIKKDAALLYHCNAWRQQFFINPYGRLKFCEYSDNFSIDLRKDSFKKGFYELFPKIAQRRFKTESKCKSCELRAQCYYCPARAYLETSDEESHVAHFCELAQGLEKQKRLNQPSIERGDVKGEVPVL